MSVSKSPSEHQDRQAQLVRALVAERRIDAHCRRAVRDLYHLGDIVDVHAVALGERFDLIAVTLARVDIGKVDGIDIHARKERGKAVGVVLVIMRQHHGVERRPCGAQIVRRDRAGVDVGIFAAAVHKRRVALGNEQHALPLPHVERDDVQPALFIV